MILHIWGCYDESLPLWQRIALRLLLPVMIKFVSQVGFLDVASADPTPLPC